MPVKQVVLTPGQVISSPRIKEVVQIENVCRTKIYAHCWAGHAFKLQRQGNGSWFWARAGNSFTRAGSEHDTMEAAIKGAYILADNKEIFQFDTEQEYGKWPAERE